MFHLLHDATEKKEKRMENPTTELKSIEKWLRDFIRKVIAEVEEEKKGNDSQSTQKD